MDHAACHVVYVDKRAHQDRYENRVSSASPRASRNADMPLVALGLEDKEVQRNLQTILSSFHGVYMCTSGTSCMARLKTLNEAIESDLKPTIVILDTHTDMDTVKTPVTVSDRPTSTPAARQSSSRDFSFSPEPEDLYSFALLQHISNEISYANLSKLIVPVAMANNWDNRISTSSASHETLRPPSTSNVATHVEEDLQSTHGNQTQSGAPISRKRMMKCLEAGAVDVLPSPLQKDRVDNLVVHAYRAHREAAKEQKAFLATKRLRKRSWVGVDEEQPYAYLRESIPIYQLDRIREIAVAKAVGSWNFSAHDLSDDELVHAAFLMLRHALDMPELEHWRIPTDDLKHFLMACRSAYNGFVLYHNFRHVVDVLQAVFYFLLQLGTIPPFATYSVAPNIRQSISPIAALLKPFDALTLLISAIGHDVGHPGVNNAFLVALKAPLAQLYNDNSVLEAFHCAAYSQILRRYWKTAFEDTVLRGLLIKSILATDMGVHFKYMTDLGNLQEKLHHNQGTDGWSDKVLEEYRTLTCGLLIKCADISNVARPFEIAATWSDILQLEFANQGEMEKDVGIPTTLFGGPPEIGNVTKLANSQIGFMNIFASPLFGAVADILPGMQFAVDEITANLKVWKEKVLETKEKEAKEDPRYLNVRTSSEAWGDRSPRSGSPSRTASQPELSISEGLPASTMSSSPLPQIPSIPTSTQMASNRDSRRSSLGSISAILNSNTTSAPSHNQSRRSSVGHTLIRRRSSPDAVSFSRRSSGAYPAANIMPSRLSTRRSSNTVPSQLQLGLGSHNHSNSASQPPSSTATIENTPSSARYPSDLPEPAMGIALGSVMNINHNDDHVESPTSSGGTMSRRGEKDTDRDSGRFHHLYHQTYNRTSTQPSHSFSGISIGRASGVARSQSTIPSNQSSADRHSASSHAQTFTSLRNLPVSPTDTQATSFLTDGSDAGDFHALGVNGYSNGNGIGSWRTSASETALPPSVDTERPDDRGEVGQLTGFPKRGVGGADRARGGPNKTAGVVQLADKEEMGKDGDIIKSSINGMNGSNGHGMAVRGGASRQGSPAGLDERLVRRKGSRFFFWKKKGGQKGAEGNS